MDVRLFSRMPTEFEPSKLVPGDWVNMWFGFERHDFYVQKNFLEYEIVRMSLTTWCVDTHYDLTYDELKDMKIQPVLIGHTKKKWWWRFIPWRQLICPFKSLKSVE